ncbi:MAG TPA: A/G-specific adenine glycosylase, partial [Candidatus Paceibacterota bacterium]|nr:A/G-specific adenine glycosylase [Candidatus Paceibacterota bacterium]
FFPKRRKVSDAEIMRALASALPKGRAREWNWALMDYGAHLKRSGVRINGKSKHYAKQKAFSGSVRQARGAILRELAKGPARAARLAGLLGEDRCRQLDDALAALVAERMVAKRGAGYALAD